MPHYYSPFMISGILNIFPNISPPIFINTKTFNTKIGTIEQSQVSFLENQLGTSITSGHGNQ